MKKSQPHAMVHPAATHPGRLVVVLTVFAISFATGCGENRSGRSAVEVGAGAGDGPLMGDVQSAGDGPSTDHAYLTQQLWNDGLAEVAFYEVERSRNQYGEAEDQSFTVGTYLVKHDFDPRLQSKAVDQGGDDSTPSFKYALFYELQSGTYEYKRHHVVNARQQDLTPLKYSFTSFDWCANLYREQAFLPSGTVDFLMRSDDYGNDAGSFDYPPGSYPPALVPLLVRGLDLARDSSTTFSIVLLDGETVPAEAALIGRDRITTPGGDVDAERLSISYDRAVPSPFAEETDLKETYWRAQDAERTLLQVEGATGRYKMTLIERVRSAYWDENIYPNLENVTTRP